LLILVDLVGIEPTTSSMPWKRAPSCATGPHRSKDIPFLFSPLIGNSSNLNPLPDVNADFDQLANGEQTISASRAFFTKTGRRVSVPVRMPCSLGSALFSYFGQADALL
jgi:hypothetical protein